MNWYSPTCMTSYMCCFRRFRGVIPFRFVPTVDLCGSRAFSFAVFEMTYRSFSSRSSTAGARECSTRRRRFSTLPRRRGLVAHNWQPCQKRGHVLAVSRIVARQFTARVLVIVGRPSALKHSDSGTEAAHVRNVQRCFLFLVAGVHLAARFNQRLYGKRIFTRTCRVQ